MMTKYELILTGRPITKKNSQRLIHAKGRIIPIPSKKYKEYEKSCFVQIANQKLNTLKLACPVHVQAIYYMPDRKSRPDLIGLMQATADILEAADVLENDKYITCWDGSLLAGYDKYNPRVEIFIKVVGEQQEILIL